MPVIDKKLFELVRSSTPDMLLVPAPVIVNVPMMAGVLRDDPCHPTILIPGVRVTFSVTESLKKIVSPTLAAAIADAKVV